MSYSSTILADSPVLYWRLDDTGTTAADSSGNGNTGTIGSAFTKSVGGATSDGNTAISSPGFGNTGEWVQGVTPGSALTGLYTVEVWGLSAASRTDNCLCGTRWSGGTFTLHFHLVTDSTHVTTVSLRAGDSTTGWQANFSASALTLDVTKYHHYVATVTTTAAIIYIDGASAASTSYASTTTVLWDANHPFILGTPGVSFEPDPSNWAGRLDEVAVYPSALSAANILAHYQAATAGALPGSTIVTRQAATRASFW